jgi:hypothetical protein
LSDILDTEQAGVWDGEAIDEWYGSDGNGTKRAREREREENGEQLDWEVVVVAMSREAINWQPERATRPAREGE